MHLVNPTWLVSCWANDMASLDRVQAGNHATGLSRRTMCLAAFPGMLMLCHFSRTSQSPPSPLASSSGWFHVTRRYPRVPAQPTASEHWESLGWPKCCLQQLPALAQAPVRVKCPVLSYKEVQANHASLGAALVEACTLHRPGVFLFGGGRGERASAPTRCNCIYLPWLWKPGCMVAAQGMWWYHRYCFSAWLGESVPWLLDRKSWVGLGEI